VEGQLGSQPTATPKEVSAVGAYDLRVGFAGGLQHPVSGQFAHPLSDLLPQARRADDIPVSESQRPHATDALQGSAPSGEYPGKQSVSVAEKPTV
jgi:hypothetical protein